MQLARILVIILSIVLIHPAYAKKNHHSKRHVNKVSIPAGTLSVSQLAGFDSYPSNVKKLITDALNLADKHLTYKFGSDHPDNNGMDCSGTISYLLKNANVRNPPRTATELYQWAWENGEFFAVNGHHFNSFEFSELRPGDLLFWTGTYPVRRDPAISHVMLYLGKDKNNRPLVFGATDRRSQHGKPVEGVGVFAFNMPSQRSKSRFLGYACVPHVSCD